MRTYTDSAFRVPERTVWLVDTLFGGPAVSRQSPLSFSRACVRFEYPRLYNFSFNSVTLNFHKQFHLLPQGVSVHSGQPDLLSITSREEMFSVTEIEVPTVTTVIQTSANTTNEFDDLSKMVGENNEPTRVTVTSFPSNHDRLLSVTTSQKSTTATLSTSRVDSYVVYGQSVRTKCMIT